MLRALLIAHRYTAVAVGLLMALWCLSGFVMMYQEYPSFTDQERLRALEPLDLAGCCRTEFLPADDAPLAAFRIEMLRGEPVLRQNGVTPLLLRSGAPLETLTQQQMLDVAATYARTRGIAAQPAWRGQVDVDQWTIQNARRNQPAHRLALHDPAGTELYVNAARGEIFQDTTRRERVLSWLGAIPHWLYFADLRRNGPLWSKVVIWTSVLGTFLAVTGLTVGILRFRRRRNGGRPLSPFQGWWYWHHVSGLVFGVLLLTWVVSGLLTMNPWGLLESGDTGARVVARFSGEVSIAQLRTFLQSAPAALAAGEFVQLEGEAFDGRLQVIARRADGSLLRLDASARPDPLQQETVHQLVNGLDARVARFERLTQQDAYYYNHKWRVELPVYRAILADPAATRLYISPTTGAVRVVDAAARQTRWFERALHGLDLPGLRARPLWDIVTLLLLGGATALAITGSWMALQRIRADLLDRT